MFLDLYILRCLSSFLFFLVQLWFAFVWLLFSALSFSPWGWWYMLIFCSSAEEADGYDSFPWFSCCVSCLFQLLIYLLAMYLPCSNFYILAFFLVMFQLLLLVFVSYFLLLPPFWCHYMLMLWLLFMLFVCGSFIFEISAFDSVYIIVYSLPLFCFHFGFPQSSVEVPLIPSTSQ